MMQQSEKLYFVTPDLKGSVVFALHFVSEIGKHPELLKQCASTIFQGQDQDAIIKSLVENIKKVDIMFLSCNMLP